MGRKKSQKRKKAFVIHKTFVIHKEDVYRESFQSMGASTALSSLRKRQSRMTLDASSSMNTKPQDSTGSKGTDQKDTDQKGHLTWMTIFCSKAWEASGY